MATQTAAPAPVPSMTANRDRCRGQSSSRRVARAPARLFAAGRALALVAVLAALFTAVAAALGPQVHAQEGPRFVSLKAERANLRVGPGRRYPIEWVYTRRGLPLLVVAHFDQWRWVLDHEGTKGWMHKSLLSTHRTVIVMGGVQTIRERPLTGSPAVLRAEAGVVADLLDCEDGWCHIALAGEKGWVPESALWGVRPPAQ